MSHYQSYKPSLHVTGQQRWKKVHAKNFEKMDSLDQYLEKKKKRTELLTGSAQKARHLAEQTSSALKKLKSMTGGSLSTKKVSWQSL